MGHHWTLEKDATVRRDILGRNRRKLGNLAIQLHFTLDAEAQGRNLAARIAKWFPNISFTEDPRKGEERYSVITFKIW